MKKLFLIFLAGFTFWLPVVGTAQEIPVVSEVEIPEPQPETPETSSTEDVLPSLISPTTGEEVMVPLSPGAPAPFAGVLLNVYAVAWLEAEPVAMQERAQAWVNLRLTEIRLLNQAEIDRLTLRITTLEQENLVALQARDQQIESLTRINNELRAGPMQWWEQVLWIGGALLLGAAVGFIGGVLAN